MPCKSGVKEVHAYKIEKYGGMPGELRESVFRTNVFAVGVGGRWFIGSSTYDPLATLFEGNAEPEP